MKYSYLCRLLRERSVNELRSILAPGLIQEILNSGVTITGDIMTTFPKDSILKGLYIKYYKIPVEIVPIPIGFNLRNSSTLAIENRTPLYNFIDRISQFMRGKGLTRVDCPVLITPDENFTDLLVPIGHPSRSETDTFRIGEKILRTHMTPATVASVISGTNNVYAIGKVYRRDNPDRTHTVEFHQVDVASLGNIVDMINFCREFFEFMGLNHISFSPDYFPFTEPSFEISMGEIELAGCGILREEISGGVLTWAMGFGIERLMMQITGSSDIKDLYPVTIPERARLSKLLR